MRVKLILVTAIASGLIASVFTPGTDASDWIGVYARIDKVVLEPSSGAPDRIQIWGAFTLASKTDRNSYQPAERGYLYFSLAPGKEDVCRKEWADLKAVAGTDQVIGFGGRDKPAPRLRKADAKPADPDAYPVGFGLVKMSDRSGDYAPIRELRSLPRGQR
ncbi:MAG TPA: hypothetical protein VFV34_23700 [Blastocatellia bacterium]|nr:hypothetical protein [Blastocatellia bacterium]